MFRLIEIVQSPNSISEVTKGNISSDRRHVPKYYTPVQRYQSIYGKLQNQMEQRRYR